jgi:uncharacterized membrane protein
MAGVDIVRPESCNAPLDVAFGYLADYREVPNWMFGVETFRAVGEKEHGLGAEYDATIHLGLRLHTRIRAAEWEENRVIGMDSVDGVKVRSRWYFAADGPDRTVVTAKITYQLPLGPAGRAMGRIMEPVVRRAVESSADRLVANVERLA